MNKILFLLFLMLARPGLSQVVIMVQTQERVPDSTNSTKVVSTELSNVLIDNGFRCVTPSDSVQSDYQITVRAIAKKDRKSGNLYFVSINASLQITANENLIYSCTFKKVKAGSIDYSGAGLKAYGLLATRVTDSVLRILGREIQKVQQWRQQAAELKTRPVPDIDLTIPVTERVSPETFVIAIGNEDYPGFQTGLAGESNVASAVNDARIFSEYCIKTLGVPATNVALKVNATLAQMHQAIAKLKSMAQLKEGRATIIFYYAGLGLPDVPNQESYLMPVDVNGTEVTMGISLGQLYKDLTKFPCKRVTVILDACFSGGARDQGLVAMQGERIKPKEIQLPGNLVVMSSSSAEEISSVYREMNHGIFTYFLLKKIRETKGDVTYRELFDYIYDNVRLENVTVNNRSQTPQITGSPVVIKEWEGWKLYEE